MKRLLCAVLAVTVVATASAVDAAVGDVRPLAQGDVKPLEVALALNGDVRVGETGAKLKAQIHLENWKGVAAGAFAVRNVADAAAGTTTYPLYCERSTSRRADGRTTLLADADGRRASAAFCVVSATDQKTAGIFLELEMPVERFAGAKWTTSAGANGVFAEKRSGVAPIWKGEADWIEFAPKDGETFRLQFPKTTSVYLQDDRQWTPTFTLRVSSGENDRTFDKGRQRTFSCAISAAGGVKASIDQPVVFKAGDDWIPLVHYKDVVAGSALDFSTQALQDAPAGKYGWLKNENGHFAFEKRPGARQRFYGGNICGPALFVDHKFADQIATRLARLGYNAVRIHHFDTADGVIKGSADGVTLNAAQMDCLDYFLAKLFEKGIYVTLDLYTMRPVTWRAIGIDRDGVIDGQLYKNLVLVHEPAYRNWAAFAKNLMTHVNPYTGRAYKDEPGIPLVSLINEGPLAFWDWWGFRSEAVVKAEWTKWLAARRAKDADFAKGRDDVSKLEVWDPFAVAFMSDLERRFLNRQRKELKEELGVKALVTNQNCGPQYPTRLPVREETYDYIDEHSYVDHPSHPYGGSSKPLKIANRNPVLQDGRLPGAGAAFVRVPGKPFTVSEWNYCAPGRYRGAGGILTGAIAALQDWSAIWNFCYSSGVESMWDKWGVPIIFETAMDPLALASERALITLFLRGDLEPLADGVAVRVTRDDCFPAKGGVSSEAPKWADAAWQTRIGTFAHDAPGFSKTVDLKDCRESATPPVALSPNPSVTFDRTNGTFRVVTAKTAGGFATRGAMRAGAVAFDVGDVPATVWATSLDGRPIAQSGRILVSHLTDVQADGVTYADRERTLVFGFGWTPIIVRNGQATIGLAIADADAFEVWALETDGRRAEKVPSQVRNGRLSFTANVKGPTGARMLYEVVKCPFLAICVNPLLDHLENKTCTKHLQGAR